MAKLVRFRVLDGVAVITLDAPPVNALSAPMRAGLWEVFSRVGTNDAIKAAVLLGAGNLFSAGADIREFGEPMGRPTLPELCDLIENCPKPVVGATHGQALGGGAEVLLAVHYRLMGPDARIGLPEVALGLVPGAGGTQRLPRLIGAERALRMIVSTQSIDATSAHRSGLVDGVVQGELASGAIAFAQNLIAKGQGPRRTRDNRTQLKNAREYQGQVAQARTALAGNPLHAPHRVIDCVEAAGLLPFEAGMAFEADAFTRCLAHPQSNALRHMFLAERKADSALLARDGQAFLPVDPMGKAAVLRLRKAMRAAADQLVEDGMTTTEIDAAMVDFGFRKGPFGTRDAGAGNDDVVRKIVAAMIVEGLYCVDQGAVQRSSDIDALAVHGLGFPRRHGGPMNAAQTFGLIKLRNDMRDWAVQNAIWDVPDIMDAAILDAKGFGALGTA